ENMRQMQSPSYHLGFGLALKGNFNRKALKRAIHEIVQRHEILRTSFSGLKMPANSVMMTSILNQFFHTGGAAHPQTAVDRAEVVPDVFTQTIHAAGAIPILFCDFEGLDFHAKELQIARIIKMEWDRPFDYEEVPLLRVLLFRKK